MSGARDLHAAAAGIDRDAHSDVATTRYSKQEVVLVNICSPNVTRRMVPCVSNAAILETSEDTDQMIRSILNIAWVVLGGLMMALGWWLASLVCAITIVGLPWARSCWVIGKFSLWPFGYEAINRKQLTGQNDLGTGAVGLIGMCCGSWSRLVARNRASELGSCLLRHHHRNPTGIQYLVGLIALAPVGMTLKPRAPWL